MMRDWFFVGWLAFVVMLFVFILFTALMR